MVEDPRWADVFDGIDWEYPNECGLKCDITSGFSGYKNMMQALHARFGSSALITSAIGADISKINAADYAGAAQYIDFYIPLTYDFFVLGIKLAQLSKVRKTKARLSFNNRAFVLRE